jgi:cytidine deaminase
MGSLALVIPSAAKSNRPKSIRERTADQLLDAYIRKLAKPANADDLWMVDQAMEQAKAKCKNRRSHTYCLVKGRKGYYGKPQLNCSRGREFNQCAEPSAIADAVNNDDTVVKLVVVHFKPGYSQRTLQVPCSKCVEVLRRFSTPYAVVIMKYKGKIVRFPIRRFLLFPYPIKYKNKKANL